jgi:hypothetical protein
MRRLLYSLTKIEKAHPMERLHVSIREWSWKFTRIVETIPSMIEKPINIYRHFNQTLASSTFMIYLHDITLLWIIINV